MNARGRDSLDPTESDAPLTQDSGDRPEITLRLLPTLLGPLLAAVFAFGIYFVTAAPGPWWGDGLELTAAAKVLGIPHPPGYPLYIWLGYGLLRAFGSADPARVLTLFSAFLCAGSAAICGWIALIRLRAASAGSESPFPVPGWLALGSAIGLTLMAAFAKTSWDHATYPEVYPLTFMLVGGMVLTVVFPVGANTGPGFGRVVCLSGLAGLSTLNHYSAIAAGPLVLFSLVRWGRARGRLSLDLSVGVAVVLLFALAYLWIPLRASSNPPINFGNADSLSGLYWMLSGGPYSQLQAIQRAMQPGLLTAGALQWFLWWGDLWVGRSVIELTAIVSVVALLPGVAGCVMLAKREWHLGLGALSLLAGTLMFSLFYHIPDIEGFFLPALPAIVLGWTESVRRLQGRAPAGSPRLMIATTAAVLFLLFGVIALRIHVKAIDKSWDRGAEVWVSNLFDALPEDALVLTRQGADSEIYAAWYAQVAQNRRPDVSVFGTGFIFSGWYRTYFEAEGRPNIPIFTTDRPPGSKTDYDIALIGGVIVPNLRERRVFVTFQDPVFEEYFSPRPVAHLLPMEYYARTAYTLNPPGPLLYELTRNLQIEPIARARFEEMYGSLP